MQKNCYLTELIYLLFIICYFFIFLYLLIVCGVDLDSRITHICLIWGPLGWPKRAQIGLALSFQYKATRHRPPPGHHPRVWEPDPIQVRQSKHYRALPASGTYKKFELLYILQKPPLFRIWTIFGNQLSQWI